MSNEKNPTLAFQERYKSIKFEFNQLCDDVLNINVNAIALINEYDEEKAEEIITSSKEIDIAGYELERKCIKFMAMEQPLANDLMFIESLIRIISHLKRIAYSSSNIAKYSKDLVDSDIPVKILDNLQLMGDYVQIMLNKGILCFVNKDVFSARELNEDDNNVDDLFDLILNEISKLLTVELDNPLSVISLLFIARSLERIADRVVSMGDRTIFIKTHERPHIESLRDDI